MILKARPRHLFSTTYLITKGDDAPTAAPPAAPIVLDLSTFRSRGRFTLDGAEYRVAAVGATLGTWVLERDGRELARADRDRLLPLRYQIRLPDRALTLRTHPPTRRLTLSHGDRRVGGIRPRHPASRVALLEGADELAPPVRVFVLTLALLKWRRRARSSGGG